MLQVEKLNKIITSKELAILGKQLHPIISALVVYGHDTSNTEGNITLEMILNKIKQIDPDTLKYLEIETTWIVDLTLRSLGLTSTDINSIN